ncbi:MAG TPA: class I SAM-dependent methyltransferase [Thermoanaerobaculia bacterium]|jgi:SAM-dependent methyltransferase|nr:class I SAM-dependent methyltransferase [Thermoanaerobaculia bacterium]
MLAPSARDFYDSADPARWGRDEMPEQGQVTRDWLSRATIDGLALELGCGRGILARITPRYAGLDLAFTPLLTMRGSGVQGDMEQLPFRDASVAFVFSWAAIEHVPHPERVLVEIERVLRVGGLALLAPAWHCRPWAADGLEFRPFAALTFGQKLRKALIPFRNNVLWRALFELPARVIRELLALVRKPPFSYHRLTPNLNEYVGTDCDAFTSMDPHAAILYFAKRGWEVPSHPTLLSRMLVRHGAVVVRKSAP